MARPNLVRADTLDLQDQENPNASLHHKDSPDLNHSGFAPHQAAELHHVMEERHSEEQSLADAWSMSADLTKDPDVTEQAQANGEHDHIAHSAQDGAEEDDSANNTESEGEGDGDDDMMDRMSSSPSIDDGGYIPKLHRTAHMASWPARSTSLTPSPTSSPADFNSPASSFSTLRSSPFSHPLQYLPLRRPASATNEGSPFPLALMDHYPSASNEASAFFPPAGMHNRFFPSFLSAHHQHLGRYGSDLELDTVSEEHNGGTHHDEEAVATAESISQDDRASSNLGSGQETSGYWDSSVTEWSPTRPYVPHRWTGVPPVDFGILGQSGLVSMQQRLDLAEVLFPIDGPLLDQPPSSTNSSWEDVSDSDSDSYNSEAERQPDDDADVFLDLDNRFIDSGWGGECLRDTEDIDFEFVYALHTFVATVEGQANATKGDTMVLLDDTNSYWWLVRVVKDSSIGYLPAEHIETPTERLARLNKHRNIDLSATMLSDNSEKTRNPIKKAMRRRNAKTVQFAAPTYVEASDYDYSSEEEDQPTLDPYAVNAHNTDGQQAGLDVEKAQQHDGDEDDPDETEESKLGNPSRGSFDREQAASAVTSIDEPQLSPRLVDKTEAAPLKSRKGTPRNTDSFLKDDSIETRKITLTPGILREDASSTKSASSESARNNSMESLEKTNSPPEPPTKKELKEQKKKDAKKGGMLSGLFKSKKDKKKVKDDANEQNSDKVSSEMSRESPRASPLTSGSTSPVEKFSSPLVGAVETKQRPPVVLQPPPLKSSMQKPVSQEIVSPVRDTEIAAENRAFVAELPGSEVAVEMATDSELPSTTSATTAPTTIQVAPITSEKEIKESSLSPLTNMLRNNSSKDPKPAKAKRSKQRVELDDFDSPADEDGPNPFKEQEERGERGSEDSRESLTDSPVEITSDATNTFMHGTEIIHIPMPAVGDSATGSDDDDGEPVSLSSSPSIIDHPAEPISDTEEEDLVQDNTPTPTGPQSPVTPTNMTQQMVLPLRQDSISTPTESVHPPLKTRAVPSATAVWSDSSLRSWLEDGSEVRDMLLMIHDKAGVVPVGNDHPIMKGLYDQPRKGVQDLMGQLDGLLGTFIQKRGISLP